MFQLVNGYRMKIKKTSTKTFMGIIHQGIGSHLIPDINIKPLQQKIKKTCGIKPK